MPSVSRRQDQEDMKTAAFRNKKSLFNQALGTRMRGLLPIALTPPGGPARSLALPSGEC
jgi:hypothetical protein